MGATFKIWDKQGGVLANEAALGTLAPVGSNCQVGNGDPVVLYDRLANRWLLSETANHPVEGTPGFLCVYISKTGNPVTGGWWIKTPPPAGAPGYFVRHVDDEFHFAANTPKDYLEIWAFHADFANPANATFTRLPNVPVADFDSSICNGGNSLDCIAQPNTTQRLDALPEMTMHRLQYRKFDPIETLVGNFTVDVTGQDQAGIRWFVLNKIGKSNWLATQQGTYAPDATARWMGSIAMDGCGNLALGYSVSSATVFPGIRYAGRLLLDPPGKLPRGENTIVAGLASQTLFNRWGDYRAMTVDPADDSTFWFTTEYMAADGKWQTRIASFKFPTCHPHDD